MKNSSYPNNGYLINEIEKINWTLIEFWTFSTRIILGTESGTRVSAGKHTPDFTTSQDGERQRGRIFWQAHRGCHILRIRWNWNDWLGWFWEFDGLSPLLCPPPSRHPTLVVFFILVGTGCTQEGVLRRPVNSSLLLLPRFLKKCRCFRNCKLLTVPVISGWRSRPVYLLPTKLINELQITMKFYYKKKPIRKRPWQNLVSLFVDDILAEIYTPGSWSVPRS